MAFAASQFSLVKRRPLAAGTWVVTGKFTGPASYASGGEALTNAILKAALGIAHIDMALFSPLVDPTNALLVQLVFDHVSTASTQGKLRAFNSGITAHTHDLLVKGGQVAQTHAHDFLVKGGTAAASTDALNIKATIIGKEAATDATNLAADVATKGGVQLASTASALSMISTDTLGKEAATDRTIVGSASATKGGVVSASAAAPTSEVASTTDLSLYVCRFVIYGA